MNRYTRRGRHGCVYATGPASVCWGNRPITERAFCAECHGSKDNRGVDRSKCGPLALIDRLAAYEDTGLTPEQITDLQRAWDMYGGEDGITALLNPPNDPLTLDELREMDGQPVWVVEINGYPPHWGLVYWVRKGKRNIVYVTINNGASICAEALMAAGGKIYRHKPEEGGT